MKRSTASLCVLFLAACSGNKNNIDPTKPLDTKEASNAQRAYEKGMLEKKDQNPIEATKYFEAVRNSFPYSQYAALSELALADMRFEADDYGGAATAYQEFVKNHPSHAKADYAAFRVGLAHYQDKASDFFLFPPSIERDQTPVRDALVALQKFVSAYPKSEYVPKARDMINELRERLARHDQYVVGFYWKRQAWRGAAGRLLELADAYGDLHEGQVRGDSLWRAAVAYYYAKDYVTERQVLTRLVQEAPNDPHRKEAEALLTSLPTQNAPPPEAPAEAKPAAQSPAAPQRPEAAPRPGEPEGAPAPRPEK
jgi:outer membrane protein assembly factor BamD